jgi:hypothetical protein
MREAEDVVVMPQHLSIETPANDSRMLLPNFLVSVNVSKQDSLWILVELTVPEGSPKCYLVTQIINVAGLRR